MKLLLTKNEYTSGSNKARLSVSDDLKTVRATSYSWWVFVATDSVGNVIFNNATYSTTTSRHQSDVSSQLKTLHVPINLKLSRTQASLGNDDCDIKAAITQEIACIQGEIANLRDAMAVKGSHKRKNLERAETIKALEYEIKDLTRYRDEYIGKKIIPIAVSKSEPSFFDDRDRERDRKIHATYEPYFLKPNGVLKRNEHQAFIKTLGYWSREAPRSIDKIKALLGLKTFEETITVLSYRFAQDTDNMIPDVDTEPYLNLKAWLSKARISREGFNLLSLDKIHTYLTNQLNKRDYTPSEPVKFPVAEPLKRLVGTENLYLLDDARKLRAEGRKQSHCIGGKDYINKCKRGYQALNYKGFTFFLSPDLKVLQAHGRFNSHTPETIVDELTSMIQERA